jgi:putative ABC transport system permease protein
MSTISKNLIRELRKRPWRLLGLCLIIAGGTGFYAAIDMAMESMPHTLGAFYKTTAFADLEVMILPEDIVNLPALGDIPGVAKVGTRLIMPSIISRPDGNPMTGLLILSDTPQPEVNAFQINQGTTFRSGGGSVVIERSLAKYHGYKVGDILVSKVGEKIYRDTVTGIATSPEFFSSASNPDYALPEKGTLGVAFGGIDRISAALGFTLVNDIIFKLAPGASYAQVKADVLDRLKGASIEKVTRQEEHFSHQNVMIRVRNYKIFTSAIILTLLLLAGIVAFITFDRLVIEQRREIGTLLALGYPKGALIGNAAVLGAGLGAISGLAGWPIALLLRNVFTASFMKANGLAFVSNYTGWQPLAAAMVLGILIAMVSMTTPFILLLRATPARVIKPVLHDGKLRKEFIRTLSGWENALSIPYRYALRNLIRRPGMTALSAVIMGFALGVPISYAISLTSNVMTMLHSFDQENWDLAVDFLHPIFSDEADSLLHLPGVTSVHPYFRHFGEVGQGTRFVDTRILGIEPGNPLRPTRVIEGRDLAGPPDELILSRDIAKDIGASAGTTVTMRVGGETRPFRVVGITSDIFTRQVVLPYATAQSLSQFEGKATGAYLSGQGIDKKALLSMAEIARVSDKGMMLSMLRERWKGSMTIVYVTTVFSLIMAIIFIFMTVNLNILEKKGEFATLLSLGYRKAETLKIMFTETGTQLALAIAVSVPLALILAWHFNRKMSEAWFENYFYAKPSDFLFPLLCAIILVPWVVLLSARNIFRFDLGTELRYREIG